MGEDTKTRPVAFRLLVDVYAILERKARKQGIKPSEWLKRRICYDVRRPHGKR